MTSHLLAWLKRGFSGARHKMADPIAQRMGPVIFAVAATLLVYTGFPRKLHSEPLFILCLLSGPVAYVVGRYYWNQLVTLRYFSTSIRYFAAAKLLQRTFGPSLNELRVLEVGSGPVGLGELFPGRFWGCDTRFDGTRALNLEPIYGTATQLPFPNDSFDVVLCIDTLEHLPANLRLDALRELWRVSRSTLIVGFPSGRHAEAADRALARHYRRRGQEIPPWLSEHIQNGWPEDQMIQELSTKRPIRTILQESPRWHLWLMKRETSLAWNVFFMGVLILARPLVQMIAGTTIGTDKAYRKWHILEKRPIPSLGPNDEEVGGGTSRINTTVVSLPKPAVLAR